MADDGGNGNGAAIGALKELLRAKDKSLHRLGQQVAEVREQMKAIAGERDAAVKARDEAAAAAARAAQDFDAAPHKAEAERLRGELRERDHRAAWERAMAERGVPTDARDLVYKNSGYKAEVEAPDADAIMARLEAMAAEPGVSRLLAEAAPPPPPPGSGQGRRDAAGGKWRVTMDQLRDGAWCMANADRLRQARQDGSFELVS